MSEIPEDIMKAAKELRRAMGSGFLGFIVGDKQTTDPGEYYLAQAIIAERNRCISIAQSIEPHNEAEAHLIETIVRRIRGEGC